MLSRTSTTPFTDPKAPAGSNAARRRPWLTLAALAVAIVAAAVAMLGWNRATSDADQQAAKALAVQSVAARVPDLERQVVVLRGDLADSKRREQASAAQAANAVSELADARSQAAGLNVAEERAAVAEKAAADAERARAEVQARVSGLEAAVRAAELRPAPAGLPAGAPAPEPLTLNLPPGATARDYLVVAQQAIRVGAAGEAQAALERAETRLLNRASLAAGASRPLHHPGVVEIEQALNQLDVDDRDGALATVQRLITRQ